MPWCRTSDLGFVLRANLDPSLSQELGKDGAPRRSERANLVVTEGLGGVDSGGAAGWAEACEERDEDEDRGYADEGDGVPAFEAVGHRLNEAGEPEGGG